jgi:hypothetical protein
MLDRVWTSSCACNLQVIHAIRERLTHNLLRQALLAYEIERRYLIRHPHGHRVQMDENDQ